MQENASLLQEMGILAELAYKDYDPNSLDPDLNRVSDDRLTSAYQVLAVSTNPSSGFQGMLVEELDSEGVGTKNYVFAFRGTELFREFIDDLIVADIAYMGFGTAPQQMKDAMAFVKAQIDRLSQDNIVLNASNTVFTGHSLGGSIAGMASYVFGFDAYTYNGFGIANMLWDADDTHSQQDPREMDRGIYDVYTTLGEYLQDLQVSVSKTTERIVNIVHDGYAASDLVGGILTDIVSGQIGETHFVINHTGDDGGFFSNHDKALLNKSIAIYNNLLKVFPGESYDSLSAALRHLGPADRKVSRLLGAMAELDVYPADGRTFRDASARWTGSVMPWA